MKMLGTTIALVLALIPHHVLAFDVEGFRNGMSKAVVIERASLSRKVSEHDQDTLVARDSLGNYLSFNFCKDRLVSVQQGFQPHLRQFAVIVREFNSKHGQPFSVATTSRAHPNGQIDEFGIWWKSEMEFVSVYYMGSAHGDSLSTSHQSPNDCFKVPR